jgi:hypothetical protein
LSGSTATLSNFTNGHATTAFTLNGGSTVTIVGTGTFSGATPEIVVSDAASRFVGSDGKSSKLAGTTGLKYTTASRAAFKLLFAPLDKAETDADTQTVRTLTTTQSITWTGTGDAARWSVPE